MPAGACEGCIYLGKVQSHTKWRRCLHPKYDGACQRMYVTLQSPACPDRIENATCNECRYSSPVDVKGTTFFLCGYEWNKFDAPDMGKRTLELLAWGAEIDECFRLDIAEEDEAIVLPHE